MQQAAEQVDLRGRVALVIDGGRELGAATAIALAKRFAARWRK